MRPGEIVLEDASRAFRLGGGGARTLKELFTGRGRGGGETVRALDGVSLRIAPGETVGIVGRNGAGKTSTLRVLAGIVPLDAGRAACGGRVATLIELGAGFGREFTGRENIVLNGALNGMGKQEIADRLPEIVAFSELGHFVDAPVRTYSSGMLVRLGFSIAAHLDADVLLIDEVLAVGDEAFQRKCLGRIAERIQAGATLVLVSHAPAAIERICDRVVVLDAGRVAFDGPSTQGLLHYHRMLGTETGQGATDRRFGAHRTVFIDDVEIQDAAGRRRTVFGSGDPVRIALGVRATAPTPVRIELQLRQSNGTPVFTAGHDFAFDGGGSRVVVDVPRLPLLGGDYDLVAAVHEPGDPEPGIDRMVVLSVADTPGATGAVDLRGTWTVADAVPAPAGDGR